MTIFAGPLFNFILSFFIFLAIGLFQGVPTYEPVISGVHDNSPALEAGIQEGDLVTKIDGQAINKMARFAAKIQASAGKEIICLNMYEMEKPSIQHYTKNRRKRW